MSKIDEFYKIDLRFDGDFKSAPNGDFALAKGLVNLRQRLFHKLITIPGSIVHRPRWGVGVKRFQNAIGSVAKQRELATIIKEQFEDEEIVDEVKSVQITKINDNGTFEVKYKILVSGGQLLEENVNPFGDFEI